MPHLYDDRRDPRFSVVQSMLRKRMAVLAVVVAFSLVLAFAAVAQRGLALSSPGDLAILTLLLFFSALEVLALVLITRQVFFAIVEGVLHYPRWGGLLRATVPLSGVTAFRREGKDETTASVVLFTAGKRFLVVPEDYLTDPSRFMEGLRQSGVSELPARFRATSG